VGFASGGSTGIPKRCFRPVTQAAARQRRYDERINVRVEKPLWRRGAGQGKGKNGIISWSMNQKNRNDTRTRQHPTKIKNKQSKIS